MAQFDVYENINLNTKNRIPYLLDVQNDILQDLNSRVVVPLILDIKSAKIINPTFEINSQKVVMSTAQLASISTNNIGQKVCSIKDKRETIVAAIDFLITGF